MVIHEVTSLTSDYEDAMIVTNVWFLYYDEIDYIWYPIPGCGLVTYALGKGGGWKWDRGHQIKYAKT